MEHDRSQRRVAFRLGTVCALALVAGAPACQGGEGGGEGEPGIEVADVGFMTPESVLHDPEADVYLVSNINGSPTEKDDNGFISRVSPEGEVLALKWIDGAADTAAGAFPLELNAPKGMAMGGDTLYVADIDCIRFFHRTTGERIGGTCLEDVDFLNDVALAPNGSLFFTDTGFRMGDAGLEPSGSDAVYRREPDGRLSTVARTEELGGPNGITVGSRGIIVVGMNSGELYQLAPGGGRTVVIPASDRQLDGVVALPDGGFLFSSWGDSAVYRIDPGGTLTPVAEGVDAPADIGYDAQRNRVLIPLFNENRVLIRDVEPA